MSPKDLPVLARSIELLTTQLLDKQEQLRRCESSQGKGNDLRKTIKLREEILSITLRLERAERLQETALSKPDQHAN